MAPGQQTATASVMTEAAVIAGDAARDADGIDPATATATAAATAMAAGATEATGGHSARGEDKREPLFATPCCNTSRATWSTPSEPSHKKPFFEDLSFSALFGPGC